MSQCRTDARTIALVVPSFEDTGGVPTIAKFILRTLARRPEFDVRVISLATSAHDPCNLLLSDPRTWRRGVSSRVGHCHDQDFIHVGARYGEFEFQRSAPRPELSRLLEGCDLIQVVAGVPYWARPVIGLGKPVVLLACTLTAVERRMRARLETGPRAVWRSAMTRIAAALDETALRRVDATMVINPSMHAHAESVARGTQAQVIYAPPGIDTDVFRPIEFGETSADQPYILAVGRFSDVRKNLLLLLKAYAVVVSRLDRAPDLLLAGADDPGAQFWVQAEVLGLRSRIRTQLRPSLETLVTLYQNALCLAVPSDEEGFCVVVTEAMASGIPVVSTRSGGPSPAGHLRPDPVVPAVLGQRSRIASASS